MISALSDRGFPILTKTAATDVRNVPWRRHVPWERPRSRTAFLEIDPELCNNCGRCVGKCRFDAIEDGQTGYRIYIGGRWGQKSGSRQVSAKSIYGQRGGFVCHREGNPSFPRRRERPGRDFLRPLTALVSMMWQNSFFLTIFLSRKQAILDAQLHRDRRGDLLSRA